MFFRLFARKNMVGEGIRRKREGGPRRESGERADRFFRFFGEECLKNRRSSTTLYSRSGSKPRPRGRAARQTGIHPTRKGKHVIFNGTETWSVDWDNPNAPYKLDSHGLLVAPGETLESYAARIDERLRTRARFDLCTGDQAGSESLEAEIGFKGGTVEPMDNAIIAEAAEKTEKLFGFRADWVPAFFPSRGLGLLWGGCTVITESGFPVFFLRRGFRDKAKWFIYRRDELLAHELCHAVRGSLEDETYEEHFAYMTSSSAFRRWTGNCFRRELDAVIFLFPLLLLLVVQTLVYSGVLRLPLWPFWLLAFAFPVFLVARNIPERRTYFKAQAKLRRAGFDKPDAALFRMTAEEIRTLARTPDEQIGQYLPEKSDTELRWQILIRRFQHPQTETPHENSIPE